MIRKTIDLADVEFASYPQRVSARIIDMIMVSLLFYAFLSLIGQEIDQDAGPFGDLGLGLWVWMLPLFYLAYEIPATAARGQTIGKRIMGINIVRTDGLVGIGLDRALNRLLGMLFLMFLPIVGILGLTWYFFDPLRQNIPDKIAKTYVIRTPKGFYLPERDEESRSDPQE